MFPQTAGSCFFPELSLYQNINGQFVLTSGVAGYGDYGTTFVLIIFKAFYKSLTLSFYYLTLTCIGCSRFSVLSLMWNLQPKGHAVAVSPS